MSDFDRLSNCISLSITGGTNAFFSYNNMYCLIFYIGVVLVCIIVATVSVILVLCVQHNKKSKERSIFKSTNVC